MGKSVLDTLERFENVNLYSVLEVQSVIELDSPAPGLEFTLAKKSAFYEFFASEADAQKYIRKLREEYQKKNQTLELKESHRYREKAPHLSGQVSHEFSHEFEIWHLVKTSNLLSSELPENIEALLQNPERRIVEDKREFPHFPKYLNMPKPDFDKIVLF